MEFPRFGIAGFNLPVVSVMTVMTMMTMVVSMVNMVVSMVMSMVMVVMTMVMVSNNWWGMDWWLVDVLMNDSGMFVDRVSSVMSVENGFVMIFSVDWVNMGFMVDWV